MTVKTHSAWALALGLACATAAHSEQTHSINIAAQDLSSAISELGAQTGMVVTAPERTIAGHTSAEVRGQMTPFEALEIMLQGTGLRVQAIEEQSAVVSQNATNTVVDLGTLTLDSISGSFGANNIKNNFETESSVSTLDREDLEERPGQQSVEIF